MSSVGSLVQFSQECLYFPFPLTDVTIENIVQVENLLRRTENRAENIIAFKVLSTVRNRYGVHPPTGFIFPAERVTVRFLLDVQLLRSTAVASMPDANTKDDMIVDIALVPKEQAATFIKSPRRENKEKDCGGNMYVAEAAAFWKVRGQVKPREENAARRKLRCVYGEKTVPDSLVMRMGREALSRLHDLPALTLKRSSVSSAKALPEIPRTRPTTNHTDVTRRSPPQALPRSPPHGVTARSTSLQSPFTSLESSPDAVRKTGGSGTNTIAAISSKRVQSATTNDKVVEEEGSIWKKYFWYEVPFPVLGVLLFFSFLCALSERGTFFSMLFVGE